MPRTKPKVRRPATLEDLRTKPVRTKEVAIPVDDEVITMMVKSINTKVYDDIVGDHPPTKEQKVEGSPYNLDTFAPALLAACTFEPDLTEEDTLSFWNGETWSRGELLDWFMACLDVCNQGFRVPTIANDSEETPPSS